MPFGLHNAPASWQWLIDKILGPELEPQVFVYLDDVIIVGNDFDKHLEVVKTVIQCLREAGLSNNWEKSKFFRSELWYLGYIVDKDGLWVEPDKVTAILNYPASTSIRKVRVFLGLTSWCHRFLPNVSQMVSPLTNLFKAKAKGAWGDEQRKSFQSIREKLVPAPILTCTD